MYPNYGRNYESNQLYNNYPSPYEVNDERFLWAPFLFGGLAGTALGYGIANNQMNNQGGYVYPVYPMYPTYPMYSTYPIYPTYSSNTNYYY